MNLYLISQNVNGDYDTYDSAVVAAPNEHYAKHMHPDGKFNLTDQPIIEYSDELPLLLNLPFAI